MKRTYLIAVSALVGLNGCFSLGRVEPPQQHYVLGGAGGDTSRPRNPAGLAIGVRRLELASYLETPFIVVRRGNDEIGFSEYHRWAEPLDGGINQAVSRYLGGRGQFRGVDVAPWPTGEPYDYLIQVHVLHFEGTTADEPTPSEGEVRLLATWEILHTDGKVVARGTTDYRKAGWKVGDYTWLVSSLDAGLSILADDLIASLSSLEGAPSAAAPVGLGPPAAVTGPATMATSVGAR